MVPFFLEVLLTLRFLATILSSEKIKIEYISHKKRFFRLEALFCPLLDRPLSKEAANLASLLPETLGFLLYSLILYKSLKASSPTAAASKILESMDLFLSVKRILRLPPVDFLEPL